MSSSNLRHMSVLIIDDNYHMLRIIRTILQGFGVGQVAEATDAAEAFEVFRSRTFDLIVVDFMMNMLDGVDFVRLVRTAEDSPNPYIPIIMLTAYSERSRVIEARDSGVNEFLTKPVTAIQIYNKMRAAIDSPRPFIKTPTYFGPDRRRNKKSVYKGPERRKNQIAVG